MRLPEPIKAEGFLRVFDTASAGSGRVPVRRTVSPRDARSDVFISDRGLNSAASPAAPVTALFPESNVACDRDFSLGRAAPEVLCTARSVPFDFLLIEIPFCTYPTAYRARPSSLTYALTTRTDKCQKTLVFRAIWSSRHTPSGSD